MTVVPRVLLFRVLAGVVALAITLATLQAALVQHAIGPIVAAALGVALGPALLRGASTGVMRSGVAWAIAGVAVVICLVATLGVDPGRQDAVSISWYPCGILAGAAMVWMAGHRLPPVVAVTCLLLQLTAWAGPLGVLRLGVAFEVVVLIAGLTLQRTMSTVSDAARAAAAQDRELVTWEAEQDAFFQERLTRLRRSEREVSPMLHRIIEGGGVLDGTARDECRVLEQTLRDEIRGRRLLNDAVRQAIRAHRERGATVQVLDDGGLDEVRPRDLRVLLNTLARRIAPVASTRIVIRTGRPDSPTAITVVATSPAADADPSEPDDEQVDLWLQIPREPARAPA